ncbi:MAG: amino acid adenylation domain-containing protein [Candidatus Electrothrix sp. AU1_5]|nr:amino acid adenylation domain-containing protein [Candidatus Electrothrix gigas]
MLSTNQFIVFLHQQGIKLWLDEQGRLHSKSTKGVLTPALQNELKARKDEVISFLRQTQTAASFPQATPESEERYSPFPLTDIQEAYWLGRGERFELHTPTHSYEELACQGLEPVRLEQAWQQLVKRHDMLRAIILPNGQQQILADVSAYSIISYDLTQADEAAINLHLETVRQEMFARPFPSDQWPLFDIRFTQLPTQELRIHFSLDMLIADWGSYEILLREWTQLYHHPSSSLPALSLSFRDYVLAERKIKETDRYQRAASYWQKRLSGLPVAPELPLAVDPITLKSVQFKRHRASLDSEKWSRLKAKATRLGLTPTGLLLTVFAEILTRWSKRPQFTLNLTLFNRLPLAEQAQIDLIVGDFTSLTMLVIDNSNPADTLAGRGKRLQSQLWQDLDQRYFSGVQVLRALATQQNGIGQTLMPVVFTSGLGVLDKGSSWLGKTVYGLSQTPQVWLDSQVEENEGQLWLTWDAVDALFPSGLIETMFLAYRKLLNQLATDENLWQETTLDVLPTSQQQQQQQINTTQVPISEELLHSLFIRQATADPDRTAVVSGDRTLSYGELRREAEFVARQLIEQGAVPNQLVAVVMDKGWEQVVAVLGILLSGAAYLPIDPELPSKRQQYLLEQGEVGLALIQPHLDAQSDWPETVQRLTVGPNRQSEAAGTDNLPEIRQTPDDLAYVIYTSGSTGMPKGVVTDHRGAVNTILDINRRFQVTPQDRMLALSALNFDLSVYDIFGVLGAGGTVIMPDAERRRDPQHWAELMIRHKVTLWNTVPALMQMLVDYQAGRHLDVPLRLVLMSGDWIPLDLPDRIRKLWPDADLISLGGATEASIWSICYPITTVDPAWKSIPYGRPMDNQTFHVLNERLDPCPVWVPGQLFIGGIGLAQGYWRDEEKTHAAFFPHPRTGERLYRTGDLGRWLPDGNIEFLGREDAQVKIRGHRIELGEIETCLSRFPGVKEAIVTAVGEGVREKQLAAYIVPQKATADSDDYGTEDMKGTLTDPANRAAFKLKQPGLRRFDDSLCEDVPLPPVVPDRMAYLARQSYRHFRQEVLSMEALSALLAALQPMNFSESPLPKYRYGSAGSLYPVQTYIWIKPDQVAGLAGGLYGYDPPEHRLVRLSTEAAFDETLHGGMNRKVFTESAFSLFLISRMSAIEPMYGRLSRDFCLLEAGYMSQLLMEESHRHGIGLCPIGGMRFEPVRPYFELDDDQELLHSFLGGAVSEEQKTSLPALTDAGSSTPEEEIRSFLRSQLPDYMVPDHCVMLDRLPLTANGKVDRKALPATNYSRATEQREAPVGETEQQLAEIVRSVLRQEAIGATDNFFDLGANSMDIIRMHKMIKEHWGFTVSMTDMFRLADVREIGKLITARIEAEENFEEGRI